MILSSKLTNKVRKVMHLGSVSSAVGKIILNMEGCVEFALRLDLRHQSVGIERDFVTVYKIN